MRAVNLIPSEARGDAGLGSGRSGGGAYAVLGLLAGLVLLALLYGIAHHQASSRRSEVAAIDARSQRANENAGQLSQYASFIAMRDARLQAVTQLTNSRFAWAHALYELGRVLPLGVSISSLNGAVGSGPTSSGASSSASTTAKGGTAVASATPPGSVPTLTLAGCATSQETVAVMLNRLSLIHGVAEATLQGSTSGSAAGAASGGSAGSGSSGSNCPAGSPTFTVLVTYQPLPSGGSASATPGSSSTTNASDSALGSTLGKAESTGGAG
ncbi:MAG TPA: hypothetical protein VEJ23_07775 [Solirubrobacteraceae bacterium]|nr:hypothetical protein [Solirubrobacteraceae bacterium]